jgi:hypothetical protein
MISFIMVGYFLIMHIRTWEVLRNNKNYSMEKLHTKYIHISEEERSVHGESAYRDNGADKYKIMW